MNPKPLTRLLLWITFVSLACNAPFLAQQTGGGGGVTTVAERPALIAPDDYAARVRELAAAIAALNQVQLATIEHLRSSPTAETVDADLVQQAAAAMTVAQLAEELAASTASQAGGGAQATAAAQPYVTAAQIGYLTVIETQNLRDDYRAGRVSSEEATDMIARRGGNLWSGDLFDVGTTPAPFSDSRSSAGGSPAASSLPPEGAENANSQMAQSTGRSTEAAGWNSGSPTTETVTVIVPVPGAMVSSLDPAQLSHLRTVEGQANADAVRGAVAAKLIGLGAQARTGGAPALAALWPASWQGGTLVLEIVVPNGMAFQSDFSRPLPYFEGGPAGLTATADTGGPLVSQVSISGGQPLVEPPIEVTTDQPLVTLDITAATPTGASTAEARDVSLTVQWTTTLADPNFVLVCLTASGHSASTPASGAAGEAVLLLAFSHFPDTAVCHAKTADLETTLGESQVIALEASDSAPPPTQAPTGPPATQPGPAANSYSGSFTLSQSDDGCNFSAAPTTGGTIELVVDFAGGTASGTFSGGGSGVRQSLECTGNFADLNWDQSYTGTFNGTVDSGGNLNMSGTVGGTGNGEWVNCHDAANQPIECPAYSSGGYSYPINVTGAINQGTGAGAGSIVVTSINLPTSGTWSVP